LSRLRTLAITSTCTAVVWILAPSLQATNAEPMGGGRSVYRIVVDGPITPATSDFIGSAIEEAADGGAAALVIELDTPGGLLDSMKSIVKDIGASRVPVFVWVAPSGASATSAGVFITLAAHVAAMAPGTTIGAAHPVTGQGGDIEGDMRKKVENFAASFVESIAERRGRNVEWAEKAVRESVSITETEAVKLNVVDYVAADMKELVTKAKGKKVEVGGTERVLDLSKVLDASGEPIVVDVDMTLRQRVLQVITNPNIAYLLMMAGMLGLYMEFSNPGAVFPGVAGAICLLLALLAGQVLPISSTGALLVLLGMAFLLAELFVPSFGALGFGGIVALTLGSLFLYTPESHLEVDRSLIFATIAMFSAVIALILGLLVRDRRRPAATGSEGLVGEAGVTVTRVHESGKIKVHGEIWNASSDTPIEANRRVSVASVKGLTVRVVELRE
jgi:membrane-bound serine protease (ClpP class)